MERAVTHDRTSFEAEALAPVDLLPLLETLHRQPARWDVTTKGYLDKVQKRVQRHRARAGMETATPPGWRAAMLAEIARQYTDKYQVQPPFLSKNHTQP